jgi:Arc/MetJ-type ribon-helix-helix transcriptional regulator
VSRTGTQKITVAMTDEMVKGLDEERKARRINTVPEVVRIIVSEYFKERKE